MCQVHILKFKITIIILGFRYVVDTSVACAIGPSVTQVLPHPQLISPSKTWFFGIYLNLQWQKLLQNQYFPHSESKFYQINSINQDLSNNTKGTFQFLQNSQLQFNFNIQELLHHKSKHRGTKPMHPSSLRAFQRHQEHELAFQRHQEHELKHLGSVDLITTKTK